MAIKSLSDLPGDAEIELITDPVEIAFLREWRAADDADKKRIDKALTAAGRGLLPSAEEIQKMTREEVHAMIDAWPDEP